MIKKKETPSLTDGERIIYHWYHNKFFQYGIGILLVLTIIFVFYQIAFLVAPVFNFISILFAPIVISFLFYYLLRPIVYFFETYHVPRTVSIVGIYIILAIVLIVFLANVVPILGEQITQIANTSVAKLENLQGSSRTLTIGPYSINIEKEIQQSLTYFLQQATAILSKNLIELLSIITRVAAIMIVIPFILFYLLKEDNDFSSKFLKHVPGDFGKEVQKTLKNVDSTLSSYIQGLVLISLSMGFLLFIAYFAIGLNYALILSFIALIVTTIPFVGSFMAITPALLVGLSQSPFMGLKVAIVFIIIQQLESNVISPQIIGQRLHIHPLTIILLLLAAGTLYGLVGLLLATPTYAVCKVLLENFSKIYRMRSTEIKADLSAPVEYPKPE